MKTNNMNLKSFTNALNAITGGDLQRVKEDNLKFRDSSTGAADLADLANGKLNKPRPIRDWERNHERG
jgi:hypothetical protein